MTHTSTWYAPGAAAVYVSEAPSEVLLATSVVPLASVRKTTARIAALFAAAPSNGAPPSIGAGAVGARTVRVTGPFTSSPMSTGAPAAEPSNAKSTGSPKTEKSPNDRPCRSASRIAAGGHLINYRHTPDWDQEVMKLTHGRGADIVVEVGGPQTLEHSLRAVRFGGLVALIGLIGGFGQINPLPLMQRSIRLVGINVGSADMFRAMNRAITVSGVRPVIARTFIFEHAAYAYRFLQDENHFGKTVITHSGEGSSDSAPL